MLTLIGIGKGVEKTWPARNSARTTVGKNIVELLMKEEGQKLKLGEMNVNEGKASSRRKRRKELGTGEKRGGKMRRVTYRRWDRKKRGGGYDVKCFTYKEATWSLGFAQSILSLCQLPSHPSHLSPSVLTNWRVLIMLRADVDMARLLVNCLPG